MRDGRSPHDVSSDPARQRLHFDPAKPCLGRAGRECPGSRRLRLEADVGDVPDSSRVHTYSAKPPNPLSLRSPYTSSPTPRLLTPLPTASICPATSQPMIGIFSRRPPNARMKSGLPRTSPQSQSFTADVWTLIKTSPSLGTGFSTSLSSRSSGVPYFVSTIAFIATADPNQPQPWKLTPGDSPPYP